MVILTAFWSPVRFFLHHHIYLQRDSLREERNIFEICQKDTCTQRMSAEACVGAQGYAIF